MLPVVWINMPHDLSRHAYMSKQLRGIHNHMVEGIYPKDIARLAMHVPEYVRKNRRQELACLLSHMNALQYVAQSDLPIALVLEDDMRVTERLIDESMLCSAPPDWEVLQLFTSNMDFYANTYQSKRLWSTWNPINTSSGAYTISRDAAKRITDHFYTGDKIDCSLFSGDPLYLVADYITYNFCQSYTYKYPLSFEDEFKSNFNHDHEEFSDTFRQFLQQSRLYRYTETSEISKSN